MEYDTLGRKTSMTDSDMGTWTYSYDDLGRLAVQTDSQGQTTVHSYDTLSRLSKKEYVNTQGKLTASESYSYDSGSNGYDVKAGELYKVEEKDGSGNLLRTTLMGYDPDYRRVQTMARTISGVGTFTQTIDHDFLGRITDTELPGKHTLAYQYMPTGSLLKVCDIACDAQHEVYYQLNPDKSFDVFGNLLQENYGNGVTSTYDYHPNSHRLKSKTIASSTETLLTKNYKQDVLANLTEISSPPAGAPPVGTPPASPVAPWSISKVGYDAQNRLTGFTEGGNTPASLSYDAWGNILTNSRAFPKDTYQYDSNKVHQLTQIGAQEDKKFSYDLNGNVTQDPFRKLLAYNVRNQLAQVQMNNGAIVDYDYDYTGARVMKRAISIDPLKNKQVVTTYFLGDAIEIKQSDTDSQATLNIYAGSRKVATKSIGKLEDLVPAAGAALTNTGFDPDFNPLAGVPWVLLFTTFFLLASLRPVPTFVPGWVRVPSPQPSPATGEGVANYIQLSFWKSLVIQKCYRPWFRYRRDLHEAIANFPHRRFTKSLAALLIFLTVTQTTTMTWAGELGKEDPLYNDTDVFYYVHDDQLGSSVLLTEGKTTAKHVGFTYHKAQVIQHFEYAPFGQESFALNPNLKLDPSFTGQRYDIETGLLYYKARYYDPLVGRFIQPDTVIPDAKDLQAYNRYSYVRNNPLNLVDPSGHFWGMFKKLLGAFVGALIAVLGGIFTAGLLPAAMAPLLAGMIAGALGGMAGGLVGGAISGGLKGALLGAAFGLVSGAIFGGFNFGLEKLGLTNQWARFGVMAGIGAPISAATGGWRGLLVFGAGLAGAAAGMGIGNSMTQKTPTPTRSKFHLDVDYGHHSGLLAANDTPMSDAGTGYGLGGNDMMGLVPDVATAEFFRVPSVASLTSSASQSSWVETYLGPKTWLQWGVGGAIVGGVQGFFTGLPVLGIPGGVGGFIVGSVYGFNSGFAIGSTFYGLMKDPFGELSHGLWADHFNK